MHRFALFIPIAIAVLLLPDCKKSSPRSSAKGISSFVLQASVNADLPNDINGQIVGDSIYLPDPPGISFVDRTPTISYTGASITPSPDTKENFSNPVTYMVTAADGSTISYVVVPRLLSGNKSITSFVFKAADNPGLAADLTGTILKDSIIVHADSTAIFSGLVPTITYNGVSLSPASGVKQDFSKAVTYTITAQDGTTANYTVVVSYDHYLYIGSDDGNLYALDAASGDLIWKYTTGGGIRSSPTYSNGLVYFISADSYVYALNSADGTLAWKYGTTSGGQVGDYGSNPTVQGGIVCLNTYGMLIGLDAAHGTPVWGTNIDNGSSNNSPTIAGGVLYDPAYSGQGPVFAVNATNGSPLAYFSGGSGVGNPAVVNGILYSTNGNDILDAWNVQTGTLLFGFNVPTGTGTYAGPGNSPTVYNGMVYIGGAAGLFALDANTGVLQWKNNTIGNLGASPPVAADGLVFVCSNNQYLNAIDANLGISQWSLVGYYTPSTNPTYANGTLYIGGMDGTITALAAATGQKKWAFGTAGPVYSGACILDGSGVTHHPTASGDQQ